MLDRIVIAGAGRTMESILDRLIHLAPVLVLDTSQSALDELRIGEEGASVSPDGRPAHAFVRRLGDATSRFVLEESRQDANHAVAIVAATGNDRRNIEICRLARELGFQPVVGLVIDPATTAEYEALGARAIIRAHILGHVVEQALRYDGLVMASSVGLGRGEIIEFCVLPSSPAIGIPLSQLQAEGWRIAAIYRGAELVIPTGDTVIAADDRVLVIGNPEILPGVAEQLRMGVPQFPLRHGSRIVVYLPGGRSPALEQQAEQLTLKTRATTLLRLYPRAEERKEIVEHALQTHSSRSPRHQRKIFEDMSLDGETLVSHVAQLRTLRPGLLMLGCPSRSVWERLTGRNGAAGTLCNALRCPVLFSNGAKEYGRIIYVLLQGLVDPMLTDSAIDLVRMLNLPLHLLRVSLPEYMEAKDEATDQVAAEITRRARLYGVGIETLRAEGNPIREILAAVKESDLLLIGRHPSSRDSFTSPDIALRVASAARCSTLVQTSVRS